jgi:hypothetical protein
LQNQFLERIRELENEQRSKEEKLGRLFFHNTCLLVKMMQKQSNNAPDVSIQVRTFFKSTFKMQSCLWFFVPFRLVDLSFFNTMFSVHYSFADLFIYWLVGWLVDWLIG